MTSASTTPIVPSKLRQQQRSQLEARVDFTPESLQWAGKDLSEQVVSF